MPAVGRINIHLVRRVAVDVSVAAEDLAILCIAQTRRARNQDFEHRPQVERRTANGLENVPGRRLLRERLLEVSRLRLRVVEQARLLAARLGQFRFALRERYG
jgi:hypothetical protein